MTRFLHAPRATGERICASPCGVFLLLLPFLLSSLLPSPRLSPLPAPPSPEETLRRRDGVCLRSLSPPLSPSTTGWTDTEEFVTRQAAQWGDTPALPSVALGSSHATAVSRQSPSDSCFFCRSVHASEWCRGNGDTSIHAGDAPEGDRLAARLWFPVFFADAVSLTAAQRSLTARASLHSRSPFHTGALRPSSLSTHLGSRRSPRLLSFSAKMPRCSRPRDAGSQDSRRRRDCVHFKRRSEREHSEAGDAQKFKGDIERRGQVARRSTRRRRGRFHRSRPYASVSTLSFLSLFLPIPSTPPFSRVCFSFVLRSLLKSSAVLSSTASSPLSFASSSVSRSSSRCLRASASCPLPASCLSPASLRSSLPLFSADRAAPEASPADMPLEDLARFRRKLEELTGLEFAAELRKRGVAVPGEEPQKIVDAVVRLLHDDLRVAEHSEDSGKRISGRDKGYAERGEAGEEEEGEPEFRSRGRPPRSGGLGDERKAREEEKKKKRSEEQKKEEILNFLQTLSPEESAALGREIREMEARNARESRHDEDARGDSEDAPAQHRKHERSAGDAGRERSASSRKGEREEDEEDEEDEFAAKGRRAGRRPSSEASSKSEDEAKDPSGIEPPEVLFFPEASRREYWEPKFAWRSEVATLEDQLELLEERGVSLSDAPRGKPRLEKWRRTPKLSPRGKQFGARSGSREAHTPPEKNGEDYGNEEAGGERTDGGRAEHEETEEERESRREREREDEEQRGESDASEEDLDVLLGTGEIEEDLEPLDAEDVDRIPGLVTVRDLLRREILSLPLVVSPRQKGHRQKPQRGQLRNPGSTAGEEERLYRTETGNEAERRQTHSQNALLPDRHREEEAFDEDSAVGGAAALWRRKYKGTDEDEGDEDEGDEEDEDEEEAPTQLILPPQFRSLPKDRREQLLGIRETVERTKEEEEKEDPTEGVERCTYTQTEREEDMRRAAARLLASASSPMKEDDPKRIREDKREDGKEDRGDAQRPFPERVDAYCVAWHRLVERPTGGKDEEEIEEEEEQRRAGVLLLPDASGWKDFFVRGLADRIADCCKCVVLVPDTKLISTLATAASPGAAASSEGLSSSSGPSSSLWSPAVLRDELIHRCMRFLKEAFGLQGVALVGLEQGGGLVLEGAANLFRMRREKRNLVASKASVTAQDLEQILLPTSRSSALSSSDSCASSSPSSPSSPPTFSSSSSPSSPSSSSSPSTFSSSSSSSSVPAPLPSFLAGGELSVPHAVVAFYPRQFDPEFVGAHMEAPTLGIFAETNRRGAAPRARDCGREGGAKEEGRDFRQNDGRLAERQGAAEGRREAELSGERDAERESQREQKSEETSRRLEGEAGSETLEQAFRSFDRNFQRDFLMHVFHGVSCGFAHRFWDDETKKRSKNNEAAEDALLLATAWLDIWLSPPSAPPRFNVINDLTDFPNAFKDFRASPQG
ncbi:hypothetical protein TGGT1_260800 [Toxoplasma gondii GT1]|uniref:Uncharacterized protein n=2 Tax=Toxoplasma gondii TaxID=5811 RepID=S7UY41_TOXGG|nr:hypothetical protein TGGT1_260800 [Toxoplasma gondii GT1]KAF4641153.1 hypothetical protein TGRH88_069630 [Toxoplasma gondii]